MNNRIMKGVLVISLAFNLAVFTTVALGWVRRSGGSEQAIVPSADSKDSFKDISLCLSRCCKLSKTKTEHLERIMAESRSEEEKLRSNLEDARRDLLALLHEEDPDENSIMEKVDEISSLQGKLEKLLIRNLLRSNSVLDPEERKKFQILLRCSLSPRCDEQKKRCGDNSSPERYDGKTEKGEK